MERLSLRRANPTGPEGRTASRLTIQSIVAGKVNRYATKYGPILPSCITKKMLQSQTTAQNWNSTRIDSFPCYS